MFDWLAPLSLPVIQRAIGTLLVAGATFSLLGVFIITLNLTAIRFSLMHVALLGASLAIVAGWDPMLGGIMAIAVAAFGLGPLADRLRLSPAAVSAFLMTASLAVAFILFYEAGVPAMEVFSLFAGSVLTVRPHEAWTVIGLGTLICGVIVVFYRELQAVLYNQEMAKALGVPVRAISYALLGMIGVAIAMAMRLVGALLVDALILLPAMVALPLARSLGQALLLAACLGFLTALGGAAASLSLDWPIGASVGVVGVVMLGIAHLVVRPLVAHRRS